MRALGVLLIVMAGVHAADVVTGGLFWTDVPRPQHPYTSTLRGLYSYILASFVSRSLGRLPTRDLLEVPPTPLQLRQELYKAWVFSKAVETRIARETRVARETVISRGLGPVDRLVRLVQRRVRRGDVIRRVMEMAEGVAKLDGTGDRSSGLVLLSCSRQ